MSSLEILRRQLVIIAYVEGQYRYLKRAVTISEIHDHLSSRLNTSYSRRTLQRDLRLISLAHPDIIPVNGRTGYWTMAKK